MKIALVGNQNSGKTSLFNLLTGLNQKVGNWPGVTIERKSGMIKGTNHELIDLPGIYSLSPYSSEEEISRNFLLNETPDLIVNIIDVTSMERSLYLTTQLLELDTKIIIVLNMIDVIEKKGISIDSKSLAKLLNVDTVEISALKKTGIKELMSLIENSNTHRGEKLNIFDSPIESEIKELEEKINNNHKRFFAIKILENDKLVKNYPFEISNVIKKLEDKYQMDIEEIFASGRYQWIEKINNKVSKTNKNHHSLNDKLDNIFLNKYFSIPIFMVIMFLVYFLSVGLIGSWTVDLIDGAVSSISGWLETILTNYGASNWSTSLIVDGIIAGVGAVINFVPQLLILFTCISILETTGYMSRISFLLDKIFKKFGLSGKSLVPFIVGSGCSVPGIMTTRTIEDNIERKMSIMLTPFIPCSAKLPIIALFAGFFFDKHSGLISASLYFFAIIIILLSAFIMKKFIYKGESSTYISELPEYHLPNFNYVFKDVLIKTWSFIKRAGSIILLASIAIWFLLSFSWRLVYGVDVNHSILASIGNSLSWVFYPMLGEFSWAATVSAIQGMIAKEQVVSSMAIIAGFSEEVSSGSLIFNNSGIFSFFTGASAYSFMVFNLFSAPCFASIGAMRREFGSTKMMFKAITFQTLLAIFLASLVYWSITLIGGIL